MADRIRFKNEKRVELDKIEGDVEIKDCTVVAPKTGSAVTIIGALRIDGETTIAGSLSCHSLLATSDNTITVEGHLTVNATAKVDHGSLCVTGSANAKRFDVEGGLIVKGNLTCQIVDVGGGLEVDGDLKTDKLEAGGSARIGGKIDASTAEVGGAMSCNHGFIKNVDVGGAFKATGAIEIGDLDVGGAAVVGPGSKILTVDVGGVFKATGDVTFESIDVGGTVNIEGNATGKSIDVGGVLKVEGSLILAEKLEVGGAAAVSQDLHAGESIDIGGSLRVGSRIESRSIEVGGAIGANHIKALDQFSIGRRGEVRGLVEGGELLVREKARGESFYGKSIRVEEGARVQNLYGEHIYLERDVTVEGDLLYTGTLETERDAHLTREPRKVAKLPSLKQLIK
jgi:cytoskeletal protein CcmA (bactofilin family)